MRDQIIVYAALTLAGAFAGLIRHMKSKKDYGVRAALTSAGFSVIVGVGVVAIHMGMDVVENPFGPLGYVLLIGYFQPNLSGFVSNLLTGAAETLKSSKGPRK